MHDTDHGVVGAMVMFLKRISCEPVSEKAFVPVPVLSMSQPSIVKPWTALSVNIADAPPVQRIVVVPRDAPLSFHVLPLHLTRMLLSVPVRAIVVLMAHTLLGGTSISQLPDAQSENAVAIELADTVPLAVITLI